MIVLTFGSWLATIGALGRHVLPVLQSAEGLAEMLVLGTFAGLLIVFWLLGSYYLALVVVYWWSRRTNLGTEERQIAEYRETPPVAILCPTCDDFQRDSVLSGLKQEYPAFHVFVLDDSRTPAFRREVDAFAAEFSERVTVVRRPDRSGYKAGNLNHALRGPASAFPLFVVMDADERIPADFLGQMVSTLADSPYAFVQANHRPNPRQTGLFPKLMGQTIIPFWAMLLAVKNRYGFVPCVGHGLLIRHCAWQAVGGFPEVASEDIAFSSVLLARGLRGVYAEQVVCHEDFPDTVAAFGRQQERYIAGVFEAMLRYWPRLAASSRATWSEKIDLFLSCLPLYVPILSCLFALTIGVGFPICFGQVGRFHLATALGTLHLPYIQTFDDRFQSMWGPVYVCVSLLFSASPAFPMLALATRGIVRRPVQLLVVSNLVYMGTMWTALFSLCRFLLRYRTRFLPTGARIRSDHRAPGAWRFALRPQLWEYAASAALSLMLLSSFNLGMAAVAATPILLRAGRLRVTGGLVLAGVAAQFVVSALLSLVPMGMVPLVFSIHF